MDDLDLVKRFRQGVPEPGPDVTDAAKVAMTAERAPQRVITMQPRRPLIRWRVGLGVAAAAVAIAVALPAILPGGGPGGAEPAAAAVLHRFARIAARQPAGPAPHIGQFVYTESSSVAVNYWAMGSDGSLTFSVIQPRTRQIWIGVDGSGRIRETTGAASFPSPADEAAWKAAGSPDLGEGETTDDLFPAGASGLWFVDLSDLPTDPEALRDAIESRQIQDGPPGDEETFTIIGDLLRETSGSPEFRAALYEVAASLPGVRLIGETIDASGRPGIAVAYEGDVSRTELIFDARTAALLGESDIALDGYSTVPAGTILFQAVYLASGVVDSTDETV